MLRTDRKQIDRTIYPELNLLLWDRADRYIAEKDAYATYEQRWKYIDQGKLTAAESTLIQRLTRSVGNGLFLAA